MAGLSRVKWEAEDKNSALPPLPSVASGDTSSTNASAESGGGGDVVDIYGESDYVSLDIGTLLDLDIGDDSDIDVDEEESDDLFLNRHVSLVANRVHACMMTISEAARRQSVTCANSSVAPPNLLTDHTPAHIHLATRWDIRVETLLGLEGFNRLIRIVQSGSQAIFTVPQGAHEPPARCNTVTRECFILLGFFIFQKANVYPTLSLNS